MKVQIKRSENLTQEEIINNIVYCPIGKGTFKEGLAVIISDSFEKLAEQHIEFGKKIYPNSTIDSCLIHAEKEIQEVRENLSTLQSWYESGKEAEESVKNNPVLLEEFADVFLCMISAVGKAGFTPSQLVEAIANKIQINANREWKQNPDGTYSHVK